MALPLPQKSLESKKPIVGGHKEAGAGSMCAFGLSAPSVGFFACYPITGLWQKTLAEVQLT